MKNGEHIMKGNSGINDIEQKYIKIQNELLKKINMIDVVDLALIKTVAGVDLAYWKKDDEEYAVCCIVVLDYDTHRIIEKKESVDKIDVPYIPGCLAFREIPLFMKAYKKLESEIDIIFFDGNGYLHPRHMGLATHAGIILNKPTVGIAKNYYKINNTNFVMPDCNPLSYTDIKINGEIYGRVLRTSKNVKPIFLSVGNRIDLETAMIVTNNLLTKESHIPLPTRLADIMTHEVRKKYMVSLICCDKDFSEIDEDKRKYHTN